MSINKLIAFAKLGELTHPPEKLPGGALHKMIKLTTSKGEFAIKVINPHIVAKDSFKSAYELAETIAEHFKQANIPAISALKIDNQYVTQLGKKAYLIYPYIRGQILPEKTITTHHASIAGKLFATMHASNFNLPGVDTSHYDFYSNEDWTQLIKNCHCSELTRLLPKILDWNSNFATSISILNTELVVTHRDMHSKNVLWDSHGQAYIIDWESAGLMNPKLELIGYGLEWSGILLNQTIDWPLFEALHHNYREHALEELKTSAETAFWGWLGHCALGWTAFNIHRMLGDITKNKQEIYIGRKITYKMMLPCLHYIAKHEKSILDKIHNNHQVSDKKPC